MCQTPWAADAPPWLELEIARLKGTIERAHAKIERHKVRPVSDSFIAVYEGNIDKLGMLPHLTNFSRRGVPLRQNQVGVGRSQDVARRTPA